MSETTNRVYELGYVLVPTIAEPEVPTTVAELKKLIEGVGGTMIAEGTPEFIDLAYTMEKTVASKKYKYDQGYFGWIKFEGSPESMEQLKKILDLRVELIRYLLVKTHTENTVIFKKPKIEARREMAIEDEGIVEISDEDLKEDHELLPNVEGDILEETATQAPLDEQEKEE